MKAFIEKFPVLFLVILSLIIYVAPTVLLNLFSTNVNNSSSNDEYIPITPRHMKGVDTIRANDSLYIINFKINKVIPDTIDSESQDKYDYETEEY